MKRTILKKPAERVTNKKFNKEKDRNKVAHPFPTKEIMQEIYYGKVTKNDK